MTTYNHSMFSESEGTPVEYYYIPKNLYFPDFEELSHGFDFDDYSDGVFYRISKEYAKDKHSLFKAPTRVSIREYDSWIYFVPDQMGTPASDRPVVVLYYIGDKNITKDDTDEKIDWIPYLIDRRGGICIQQGFSKYLKRATSPFERQINNGSLRRLATDLMYAAHNKGGTNFKYKKQLQDAAAHYTASMMPRRIDYGFKLKPVAGGDGSLPSQQYDDVYDHVTESGGLLSSLGIPDSIGQMSLREIHDQVKRIFVIELR